MGTGLEPTPTTQDSGPGRTARVIRVVDGDTILITSTAGGEAERVRLIGIDAPESVKPDSPVECFGPQAAAFAERSLEGRTVRLEFDIQRRDRFGRTLAYVWLGPRLFNQELLLGGYATVTTFPPNVRHVDRFVTAQQLARLERRGLWGACSLVVVTGAGT